MPALQVGPFYALAPIKRTHRPPVVRADGYRRCLRLDFKNRCAYCLSHEREVAPGQAYGGFEVEHFRPESRFPKCRDQYSNLLWACQACNRAKRAQWPTDAEARQGCHFVDPTSEGLGKYVDLQGDRVVSVNTNPAGDYMIEAICLNSPVHKLRRHERKDAAVQVAYLTVLLDRLRNEPVLDPAEVATVEAAIERADVTGRPPWDQPIDCVCLPASPGSRKRRTRRERKVRNGRSRSEVG
jgi:hypothetical protein